ncbi:MAG: 16S rRNA (cytidine(1402)-2'-O)-methyltransferase [Candidatus Zixiibacteriota bacterium]|nr:MAG: 16S rRNA (cytidine(1402)-2'-O)-methyltransferase [candidate division Zixibacteria bacterium]
MGPVAGKIYLVPTPIGNMGDMTARAVEVLAAADIVACEDTRHSGRFLKKLGLKKKLVSYHDFNEASRARKLIGQISQGLTVAVITDGGSPGISDPAYRVVRAAIDNDIQVVPLPGPTAIIPALTASGLATDRFFFEGFLPHKTAARKKRLEKLTDLEHTLVFFESPHRVGKTLEDILAVLGNRPMCLAREVSKKFEEFVRGSTGEVCEQVKAKPPKGEIVIVVAGHRQ